MEMNKDMNGDIEKAKETKVTWDWYKNKFNIGWYNVQTK